MSAGVPNAVPAAVSVELESRCRQPLARVAARVVVAAMEPRDRLLEAGPAHEPHRIERPAVVVDPQAVDGDDPGMLEPAGDLRLQQEPRTAVGVIGALGLDLL